MTSPDSWQHLCQAIRRANPCRRSGHLLQVSGSVLMASLPGARVGERVRVGSAELPADIIGFNRHQAVLLPAGDCSQLASGDTVAARGETFALRFSENLTGRVIDARGRPLDGRGGLGPTVSVSVDFDPPHPLHRSPVEQVLETRIKSIDCLATIGRGQRLGLFAEPGVGKSTLLAQLARNCQADVVVLALVGERGREVREFIERDLGPRGRQRTVVVCATSDRPAAERSRAVPVATAIAAAFRRRGLAVLLLVDSLTRHARACREIALAAGEIPGQRGFPPSVIDGLSRLLERAGNDERGSVTAIYTVLTEGAAEDDPLAEEIRSLLDGHLVLSRGLAQAGVFPALDPGRSLSRLMSGLADDAQRNLARRARLVWSAYRQNHEALEFGLYQRGGDAQLDRLLDTYPRLLDWMRQAPDQGCSRAQALHTLAGVLGELP